MDIPDPMHSQSFANRGTAVTNTRLSPLQRLTVGPFSLSTTPLVSLHCSGSAARRTKARTDAFRSERICSLRGKAKRANPLLQKRNANYEHDRKHNRRRMHYPTGSSDRFNRQTYQISIPTTGVENCFIAGMPDTRPTSNVRYAGTSGGILEDAHRSTSIF